MRFKKKFIAYPVNSTVNFTWKSDVALIAWQFVRCRFFALKVDPILLKTFFNRIGPTRGQKTYDQSGPFLIACLFEKLLRYLFRIDFRVLASLVR